MNEIEKQPQNKLSFIVNIIGVSVAFTIHFPELMALLSSGSAIGQESTDAIYPGITWIQVGNEILFTYLSIVVLFFVNEKIFKFNSIHSNIDRKKIFFSFSTLWIINSLLGYGFIVLHNYGGIAAIETMVHVNSHPLRNFLIASIVTMSEYLIHHNKISKKIILENQQLKTENVKNQFAALKNQLNPHMLFNSLNTLYSLIRENPDKAQDYLSQLSKVIRYTLHDEEDRESNAISLKEELDYIHSYIYLLKMRYEENLHFCLDIDEQLHSRKIPRMAIQVLVENAVKHNEISKKHPLVVCIRTTDDGYLEVSNKLQLRRGKVESTGIGLENLGKRYQLLFDKEMEICENNGVFKVIIPLA